jgi:hypothetical protein
LQIGFGLENERINVEVSLPERNFTSSRILFSSFICANSNRQSSSTKKREREKFQWY